MRKNPFVSYYKGNLSEAEIDLLVSIKQNLIRISQDAKLRQYSSQRNRKIKDPVVKGSLIHGVREFNFGILDLILNNGILCAEFLNKTEDGETFFHADFVESNINFIVDWQYALNSAPSKFPRTIFRRIRDFMPSIYSKDQKIALVINRSSTQSWKKEYESKINNIKSRFIKSIPIEYPKEGPNQVSILGGVASTDIHGIIISPKVSPREIVKKFYKYKIYIPLFNSEGAKIF